MTLQPSIEPFNAKFENIDIHAHKIEVEIIHEVNLEIFERQTAYTNIWESLSVNGMPDYKNLVGGLHIIFRNQGEDFNIALLLEVTGVVRADGNTESCDTVCKYVQFLFDWMKKYVEENKVKDKNNKSFIVPDFLYSKDQFRGSFPE